MVKDKSGFFKIYSFFTFDDFRFFGFYLGVIEKSFLSVLEKKKDEILSNINDYKIFYLNVTQLIYGLEDTCNYLPFIPTENLVALMNFTPTMVKFLSEFHLARIYTYCLIEEFLLENDEKIFSELESLSRSYSYKNGGILLSLTRILFFLLNEFKENEGRLFMIIKFLDALLFDPVKNQSFEKTLNQINNHPLQVKIRKWMDNILYFSGKKTPLIEVFSQVILKLFLI